jgi:hypothetical protein
MSMSVSIAALVATSAGAVPTYDDLSAWQAAVGSYERDTDYGTNSASIGSLTLDDGTTIDFATDVTIYTVGAGWATWSGGYTGQVLYTQGATTLDMSLLTSVDALGFFMQPNPFSDQTLTLTLEDGSVISQVVSGTGGAAFFGWVGAGVTSMTASGTSDFAIGDFYTSAVAEPGALGLLGLGLIGAAAMRRRRA